MVSERTNYIKFSVLGNNKKAVPGVHVSSINLTHGFWLLVIQTDAHKTPAGTERLSVIGVSGKQSFVTAISYNVTAPRVSAKPYTGPVVSVIEQVASIKRGSSQIALVQSENTRSVTFMVVDFNGKAIPGVKATSKSLGHGFLLLTVKTDAHKTPPGTERLVVVGVNGKQKTTKSVSYRVTK